MSKETMPNAEHRFTFGLWTVGNPGRDPFGEATRPSLSPAEIVDLLGEAGGVHGVNFHDNDLVPIDATEAESSQIKKDFRAAELDDATRALLEFADKMTRDPHRVADDDFDRLRAAGFSDEDILEAAHIVGLFNYLVRLADVFDLDLDPEVSRSATYQTELWEG